MCYTALHWMLVAEVACYLLFYDTKVIHNNPVVKNNNKHNNA